METSTRIVVYYNDFPDHILPSGTMSEEASYHCKITKRIRLTKGFCPSTCILA